MFFFLLVNMPMPFFLSVIIAITNYSIWKWNILLSWSAWDLVQSKSFRFFPLSLFLCSLSLSDSGILLLPLGVCLSSIWIAFDAIIYSNIDCCSLSFVFLRLTMAKCNATKGNICIFMESTTFKLHAIEHTKFNDIFLLDSWERVCVCVWRKRRIVSWVYSRAHIWNCNDAKLYNLCLITLYFVCICTIGLSGCRVFIEWVRLQTQRMGEKKRTFVQYTKILVLSFHFSQRLQNDSIPNST